MDELQDLFGPPIHVCTNEQAIDDGFKVRLHDNIFATTNCLLTVVPEAFDEEERLDMHQVMAAFVDSFKAYDRGEYHDATAQYPEEADRYHAVYSVRGHEVWFILDGDGTHLLLPEDH